MRKVKKSALFFILLFLASVLFAVACPRPSFAEKEDRQTANRDDQPIILRISNWEEYIDEGEWDESEVIDLESGDIFGETPMIRDFENWYKETYGREVRVEYSTFGTNEILYNMLTLGDTFDLICPSEYMFMKMLSEDMLEPLSDDFFDRGDEHNYYINGVSPYIRNVFDANSINDIPWSRYAAGYMWGVTGFIYNPQLVSKEEASTWKLLTNPDFHRQITIKDNVRDMYFAAVGAIHSEQLRSEEFRNNPDYPQHLEELMNNVSDEELQRVQDYLQVAKDNVYAFETDSGKADMITGKVLANYQWSGDAIYAMDQAEEDDFYLDFAVPEESTNIYFDAWVMLKKGIAGDQAKKHAAEAFINFISRPDNAIRNMYYIGYTSVISGGADDRVLEYVKWNYESDAEENTVPYDLNYFFNETPLENTEHYIINADEEQLNRQLSAQYPDQEVMNRSSIMRYFEPERNAAINSMWVNVRCYNITGMPTWGYLVSALIILLLIYMIVRRIQKMKEAG